MLLASLVAGGELAAEVAAGLQAMHELVQEAQEQGAAEDAGADAGPDGGDATERGGGELALPPGAAQALGPLLCGQGTHEAAAALLSLLLSSRALGSRPRSAAAKELRALPLALAEQWLDAESMGGASDVRRLCRLLPSLSLVEGARTEAAAGRTGGLASQGSPLRLTADAAAQEAAAQPGYEQHRTRTLSLLARLAQRDGALEDSWPISQALLMAGAAEEGGGGGVARAFCAAVEAAQREKQEEDEQEEQGQEEEAEEEQERQEQEKQEEDEEQELELQLPACFGRFECLLVRGEGTDEELRRRFWAEFLLWCRPNALHPLAHALQLGQALLRCGRSSALRLLLTAIPELQPLLLTLGWAQLSKWDAPRQACYNELERAAAAARERRQQAVEQAAELPTANHLQVAADTLQHHVRVARWLASKLRAQPGSPARGTFEAREHCACLPHCTPCHDTVL